MNVMYLNECVMNKLKVFVVLLLVGTSVMAQKSSNISPADLEDDLKIEILEINRVEKYGWDNLEIIYKLTNNSNYDIQKIDFNVHLAGADGNRIGSINVHAFRIPKKSDRTIKFAEVSSDYVNAQFEGSSADITNVDVIIDSEKGSIVTIKTDQLQH